MNAVYIVGTARTPIGSFQGSLSGLAAHQLGAHAIRHAIARAGLPADALARIDEVLMGNVLQAGQGQAPARQAAIGAGLPNSVGATTVHKVCGSGLKTVIMAQQAILSGDASLVVAGGMESMSNAPYLLRNARGGMRMGHGQVEDSMILDGLWDPYRNVHMGNAGELCAAEYRISREEQDAYAIESYRRANAAIAEGFFKNEIVPVEIAQKKGPATIIDADEEPGRGNPSKVPQLNPAFQKDGTITAANASKINDGASAMLIASEAAVAEFGLKPLARIVSTGRHAQAPEWFTTAPAGAIAHGLKRGGIQASDVDYFEINEAFSVVAIAVARELGLSMDRVNARGGAVALGHPIGASGNRILGTLVNTLHQTGARYGCAGICLGGGEAVSVLIERC
jgi:acetyl-CoA C-acetyltransferase